MAEQTKPIRDEATRLCKSETLSKFKLFTGFKEEELTTLLSLSDFQTFQPGARIVTQDEPGLCMYVILRGAVRVHSRAGDQEVELAELHSGDFFGELSLVDDGPRSATVDAVEETQVLRITRMVVGVLAGVQPSAAIHLLAAIGRSLVNRLRAGNQKYLDLILLGHKESAPSASAPDPAT
ncbi:MAG TPA: cyclic nucleotide-binding domain-containing protein [Chthoniobacterales bacterium]|nr:cyclic nucleotide-binding domain-containing protein [Chthoniobacterales bacterium]